MQHLTMNLENISLKLITADRGIVLHKNCLIYKNKLVKLGQEVIYSSGCFNYNYMYSDGYETCDKLIWASNNGCINTNTLSKQGIPKININNIFPSSTLGFGCSPHKYTCDLL